MAARLTHVSLHLGTLHVTMLAYASIVTLGRGEYVGGGACLIAAAIAHGLLSMATLRGAE